MLKKIIEGYCQILNLLTAAALAVMVILVFGNVVMRYGFNSGITMSEELSRWLFVWLTFLGAIVAMINWDTTRAVMEASMAIFYACGMVAAVSMAVILLNNLWRLATGDLSEQELVGVRESEEEPIDVPAPLK